MPKDIERIPFTDKFLRYEYKENNSFSSWWNIPGYSVAYATDGLR